MIALLIAVAIIVKFLGGYWGAAALVVPSFRGRRLGRWYRRHPALSTRYCDGLAVPAAVQHSWVLHGDDRGSYETERGELPQPHYPALGQIKGRKPG
ncbi:hypothetical protein A5657_21345 [Mycobacterium kubicae]|nr:hypothetical protein A5657_21345 [Mycobacterium kubicae]